MGERKKEHISCHPLVHLWAQLPPVAGAGVEANEVDFPRARSYKCNPGVLCGWQSSRWTPSFPLAPTDSELDWKSLTFQLTKQAQSSPFALFFTNLVKSPWISQYQLDISVLTH